MHPYTFRCTSGYTPRKRDQNLTC